MYYLRKICGDILGNSVHLREKIVFTKGLMFLKKYCLVLLYLISYFCGTFRLRQNSKLYISPRCFMVATGFATYAFGRSLFHLNKI
jgi:hypothetical protein